MHLPPVSGPTDPASNKKKISPVLVLLLVIGACGLCTVPVLAAILFPVFSQAKVAAQSKQSLEHLQTLGIALTIYSADFDDTVCPVERWNRSISGYVADHEPDLTYNVFADPLLPAAEENRGFGMNAAIDKKSIIQMDDPSQVVAFALTKTPGQDALVTRDTLRPASQRPFRTIWTTTDGIAKKALIDEAQRLQWKPALIKK